MNSLTIKARFFGQWREGAIHQEIIEEIQDLMINPLLLLIKIRMMFYKLIMISYNSITLG